MPNTLVYVDIDGVLRNWVIALDRLYQETFPGESPVKVFIYDLAPRYPRWGEDVWDIAFEQYPERLFLHDAEEYHGMVEAVNWLSSQDGVTVKLLSKQEGVRVELTDTWLDQHGVNPAIERNYMPYSDKMSKGEYLSGLSHGDQVLVLLDDSGDEIESAKDIVDFVVLVTRDWNQTYLLQVDGKPQFLGGDTVFQQIQFLLNICKEFIEKTTSLDLVLSEAFWLLITPQK